MFDGFILETTAAPGSSATIVLSGAAAGRRAFLGPGAFTSGASVMYVMDDGTKQEWGVGVLTGGASTTLTRDAAPRNSLGTNARLTFGGTTRVYSALLPERAGYKTVAGFSLPSSVISNPLWAGASAGSSTAYTISTTPAETAYVAGTKITWRAHATCGNAPTIQYGALGVKNLRRIANGQVVALLPGDIVAGQIVEMVYSDAAATWVVTSRLGGDSAMQVIAASSSGSSASSVDFELPATTFNTYCLQVESAAPAANAVPMLRFSFDAGATYAAGASDYTVAAVQGLAAAVSAQGGNAAQVSLGPTTLSGSFSFHGEIWFRSSASKVLRGLFSGPTTGPVPFVWPVGAWCNVAGTPTHVRFGFVGQNVASHRVRLLGGRFD